MPRSPEDPRAADGTVDFHGLSARVVAGKYRLGRLLGEGGMGAVYEAEHLELGVPVAVKLLNLGVDADPRSIARFRREARATAAIRDEHIVQVTDAGADELGPFIVMELLRGESLAALILRQRFLDVGLAVEIARQILAGLVAAHQHQVIHRDLKPGNIFLCAGADGEVRVKILDFGVSKFFRGGEATEVTSSGELVGTPRFMSPEQARAQTDIDARADLYAVGAMLYVMVTGRFPHAGQTREEVICHILEGKVVPPREIRPDLPPALEEVIFKALALDRQDRFADARAFIAALREAAPGATELRTPTPAPAARAPVGPRRRSRAFMLAGAAAALLLAAVAWLALRPHGGGLAGPALRLGITRYTSDESIQAEIRPIADYLAARLGRQVEVVIVDYGFDPGARLLAGELDLAALSPYVYVRTKARAPGLRLLATPVSHAGASYEGLIVARADSGIRTLDGLLGKVFCWVDETSTSGYLYPRALFRRRGIDPDRAFASVRFKGTHLDALKALADGECDGAAIYATLLESGRSGLPKGRFVTLEATPRIPYDAYCVSDRLDPRLADALEAALLALAPGSQEARRVLPAATVFTGFARAADGDYDRVRAIERYLDQTPAPGP